MEELAALHHCLHSQWGAFYLHHGYTTLYNVHLWGSSDALKKGSSARSCAHTPQSAVAIEVLCGGKCSGVSYDEAKSALLGAPKHEEMRLTRNAGILYSMQFSNIRLVHFVMRNSRSQWLVRDLFRKLQTTFPVVRGNCLASQAHNVLHNFVRPLTSNVPHHLLNIETRLS